MAGVGGGIHNLGITTIVDSRIEQNTATFSGGGIQNTVLGKVTAAESRIASNTAGAGGGIFNGGLVELVGTEFDDNTPDDCVVVPVGGPKAGGMNHRSVQKTRPAH